MPWREVAWVEVWGLCQDCDRWFYCASDAAPTAGPTCPVCGSAPGRLVNRATASPPAAAEDAG